MITCQLKIIEISNYMYIVCIEIAFSMLSQCPFQPFVAVENLQQFIFILVSSGFVINVTKPLEDLGVSVH